uniref:TBC1 domain family member 25 n=1 Tax=Cacopsylla melanoneura TaxID=428564 RepID=A0A8D9F3G5_9HEMI
MASTMGYKRDAIRVKVVKYDGTQKSDCRKFSVDPQITSYEVLFSLLAKAFDVKKEFSICYRVIDDTGQETFLPLLSDYELDAAIHDASDPCLCLRIDFVDTFSSGMDQDVAECIQPETSLSLMSFTQTKVPLKLQGLIKNQVERTFSIFKGALSYMEEQSANMAALYYPPRAPLTDAEFRQFLDPVGQIIQSRELRTVIYYGGIEPSLRRVVWKHILNVYPEGMSGKERMEYTKRKSEEYFKMRDTWKELLKRGQMVGELAYVTGMVRKDVLRTDRHHVFYAGADDNCNVISLFNILTTYALNHPAVSYCQGMSDLASPLLVTMSNEAHAYICFCALMRRLGRNFLIDGITMTQRFQHLADGLEFYHPKFYEYLKSHQADDLLYCYRWLLLEMKREFAFNDALIMLEVMWASLPPCPPQTELPLYDVKFEPPADLPPTSPSPSPRENQYTKVCAIRRQTTSATSSPFKLNTSLEESALAQRRRQDNSSTTKIISTNGILKSSVAHGTIVGSHSVSNQQPLSSPHSNQHLFIIPDNHSVSSQQPLSSPQSMVQKLTQLTKDNIHRSLEKINSQGSEVSSMLSRQGSLRMSSAALNTTSTKIVRNLNEFLNFNKNHITCSSPLTNGDSTGGNASSGRDKLSKQISLDERNRREYCESGDGGKRRSSNYVGRNGETDYPNRIFEERDGNPFDGRSSNSGTNSSSAANSSTSPRTNPSNVNTSHNTTNHSSGTNPFQVITSNTISKPPLSHCQSITSDSSPYVNEDRVTSPSNIPLQAQSAARVRSPSTILQQTSNDLQCLSNQLQSCTGKLQTEYSQHSNDKYICLKSPGTLEKEIREVENTLAKKIEAIPETVNARIESSPEDDDSSEYYPMTSSITLELRQELENLNRHVLDEQPCIADDAESGFESGQTALEFQPHDPLHAHGQPHPYGPTKYSAADEIFIWENPLEEARDVATTLPDSVSQHSFVSNKSSFESDDMTQSYSSTTSGADSIQSTDEIREVAHVIQSRQTRVGLPPPNEFGGGNPFLMFLCISVLCQHSEHIMSHQMDYNEMAIYFDKMIRKHNVHKVLNEARKRYESYLCNYRQMSRQSPRV